MQTSSSETAWLKNWLYDWGGGNIVVFRAIQHALPERWLGLAEGLSVLGSYWSAPFVLISMLAWRQMRSTTNAFMFDVALCRLLMGLTLSFIATAFAKAAFALPRPFVVLGEVVYRSGSAPDSLYTMPSGHSVYVAALAAALWSICGRSSKLGLVLLAASVGWSRIVLGAHFPADVLIAFALGWASVVAVNPWAHCIAKKFISNGEAQ